RTREGNQTKLDAASSESFRNISTEAARRASDENSLTGQDSHACGATLQERSVADNKNFATQIILFPCRASRAFYTRRISQSCAGRAARCSNGVSAICHMPFQAGRSQLRREWSMSS